MQITFTKDELEALANLIFATGATPKSIASPTLRMHLDWEPTEAEQSACAKLQAAMGEEG